jgi:ribosomal-protein-serine acetyltransferase
MATSTLPPPPVRSTSDRGHAFQKEVGRPAVSPDGKPAPFRASVDADTYLQAVGPEDAEELFNVFDSNRSHLKEWHPWVTVLSTETHVEKLIGDWERHHAKTHAVHAVIRSRGRICGMINTINVDWINRWTVFSYWLSASHQGRGIMTGCCRLMINHAFGHWNLNRITIECATENRKSRAIPERLGFTLEGTVRGIERIGDRFVDHALYGLLRHEWASPANRQG